MPMSTITVAGISPTLVVLGAEQQLNFTELLSSLKMTNRFTPTGLIASKLNFEFRNHLFSGFRWSHLTNSTDTYGSLTLQSFVNAATTGMDILSFAQNGNIVITAPVVMSYVLDLGNNKIINVANPDDPQDVATKDFVENLVFTVTLAGAVTGSGTVNSTITTTLTPITTSQITDFTTATNTLITNATILPSQLTGYPANTTTYLRGDGTWFSFLTTATLIRLDQFSVPTNDVNLNSQRIINVATPVTGGDGANKSYVDDKVDNKPFASIYSSANPTGTIVTANTWTKAAGTTTVSFVNEFTMPIDNQLQYVGTNIINTLVGVSISATHDVVTPTTLGVSIFKNGIQVLPANYSYQAILGAATSLSTSVYIEFNTNDYVEVFVELADAGTILVSDMNFYVIK